MEMDQFFCSHCFQPTSLLCPDCWTFLCPVCSPVHAKQSGHSSPISEYSMLFKQIKRALKNVSIGFRPQTDDARALYQKLREKSAPAAVLDAVVSAKLVFVFRSTAALACSKLLRAGFEKTLPLDLMLYAAKEGTAAGFAGTTLGKDETLVQLVRWIRAESESLTETAKKLLDECRKFLSGKDADVDSVAKIAELYSTRYNHLVRTYHSRKLDYSRYLDFAYSQTAKSFWNKSVPPTVWRKLVCFQDGTGLFVQDPKTGAKSLINKLPKMGPVSCVFVDNSLYVLGSSRNAQRAAESSGCDVIRYVFSHTGDFLFSYALAPMQCKRSRPGVAAVGGRWIYVAGGGCNAGTYTACEKLNLVAETWHCAPTLLGVRRRVRCVCFNERFLYAIGTEGASVLSIERLDLMEEESGWSAVRKTTISVRVSIMVAQYGNDNIIFAVRETSGDRSIDVSTYLFSTYRDKETRKDQMRTGTISFESNVVSICRHGVIYTQMQQDKAKLCLIKLSTIGRPSEISELHLQVA